MLYFKLKKKQKGIRVRSPRRKANKKQKTDKKF